MLAVRVRVPASTANLGVGFDTLGLAIDRYCYIELAPAPGTEARVEISGTEQEHLPRNARNLILRAALMTFHHLCLEPPPLLCRIHNQIPTRRGLGSSAAATLGGVYSANVLCGSPLAEDEVFQLAARLEGHPDNVAAALTGGLNLCVPHANGRVQKHSLPISPHWQLCFLVPKTPLSTLESRQALPRRVPLRDCTWNNARMILLYQALQTGDEDLLFQALDDRLHQPHRFPLIPNYPLMRDALRSAGIHGWCLSGSGPTIVGFAHRRCTQRLEQDLRAAVVEKLGAEVEVLVHRVDLHGLQRESTE